MGQTRLPLAQLGLLFLLVFVAISSSGVAGPLSVRPVSALTTSTLTASTMANPECTSALCYNPIETLGGAYFTNVTSTLYFNNYTTTALNGFDVQINTNTYTRGNAWEQIIEQVATDQNDVTTAFLSAPALWVNYYNGTFGPGDDVPKPIIIGDTTQINGSLTFSAVFVSNGSTLLRETYTAENGNMITSRGQWQYPSGAIPYGQITVLGVTITGFPGAGYFVFPSGTNLLLVLRPMTNLGGQYGSSWTFGGNPLGTAETSDLIIHALWYTDSEEGIDFVAPVITPPTTSTIAPRLLWTPPLVYPGSPEQTTNATYGVEPNSECPFGDFFSGTLTVTEPDGTSVSSVTQTDIPCGTVDLTTVYPSGFTGTAGTSECGPYAAVWAGSTTAVVGGVHPTFSMNLSFSGFCRAIPEFGVPAVLVAAIGLVVVAVMKRGNLLKF
jgi:hypothetical protein